ncbi:MAG: XdhC/CoxI family protein [Anaerolineaceae bacterium]|jgi:xanthine dehydrogenase accessory factor
MKELYEKLYEATKSGQPVCLCVVIETKGAVPRHAGSKMLVYPNKLTFGSVGGGQVENETVDAALRALKTGQPEILRYTLDPKQQNAVGICGGDVTVYIEPQSVRPILLILGAGHVGRSMAKFGQLLDFRVIVSDDRTELCTSEQIPGEVEFLPIPMQEIPAHIDINEQVYIVGVTRGSDVDIVGLPAILEHTPAYIGMIGSLKRWATTKKALLEQGVPRERIDLIKSPIGIDIEAETPDEIAISILAEVIHARNR